MVFTHQSEYYQAINASTKTTNSAPFIEFMLQIIFESLAANEEPTPQVNPQVTPQVRALIGELAKQEPLLREELQARLNLSDRKSFTERYLKPALSLDLIEMTVPAKPRSRLQRYRLTPAGRKLLDQ